MKVLLSFDHLRSPFLEFIKHALIYPIFIDEGISKKNIEKGLQVDQMAVKSSYLAFMKPNMKVIFLYDLIFGVTLLSYFWIRNIFKKT